MFFPWLGYWWQLLRAPWLGALFFFHVLVHILLPRVPEHQQMNHRDYAWLKEEINKVFAANHAPSIIVNRQKMQWWPETQRIYSFLMNDREWSLLKEPDSKSLVQQKTWQWHYQKWSLWRQHWQKTPAYQFGLWTAKAYQPARWITYSLVHASWWHLASNMIFLLMFGAYWVSRLGLASWLLLYFGGALIGGLTFLFLEPTGFRPMVGASAAVSALIGAYLVNEKRKYVTFYYFFGGSKQGLLALPKFFIALYFLVDDVAGVWEVFLSKRFEEVAHAAHLGGWLWGVFFVYVIRWVKAYRYNLAQSVMSGIRDLVKLNIK